MPFSAVVVGVGDGGFEDMKVLDADDAILTDPEGKKSMQRYRAASLVRRLQRIRHERTRP